jgi:hypothetical protein
MGQIRYKKVMAGERMPDWGYGLLSATEQDVQSIVVAWLNTGNATNLMTWKNNVTAVKQRPPPAKSLWVIYPEFIEPMFGEELCP